MSSALVWFRRDLRDHDHAALAAALAGHGQVHCVFVFDRQILDPLPRDDRRVDFIVQSVQALDAALRARGGGLIVRCGHASDEIVSLARSLGVAAVYANRDYEPAAVARDKAVDAALCRATKSFFRLHKDQVIFERDEVKTRAGGTFSVFTPYRRAWLARLTPADVTAHACTPRPGQFVPPPAQTLPTPDDLGFTAAPCGVGTGMAGAEATLTAFLDPMARYHIQRDYPAAHGTSRLGVHLRFGTLSIRRAVAAAQRCAAEATMTQGDPSGAQSWLSELIWREFCQMLLACHPHLVQRCFKPAFDALQWDIAPAHFAAWKAGMTGYPLIDAGMRQLAQSGFMHNRLRMLTAGFLCKDLGVDWRLGEAWFAEKLLDFDLAANNTGWQWAASTGCDAQPWFRLFNPVTQSQRFDPTGDFIRRHVPELATLPPTLIHTPWTLAAQQQTDFAVRVGIDYPAPRVDHARARQSTLARYRAASLASSRPAKRLAGAST